MCDGFYLNKMPRNVLNFDTEQIFFSCTTRPSNLKKIKTATVIFCYMRVTFFIHTRTVITVEAFYCGILHLIDDVGL